MLSIAAGVALFLPWLVLVAIGQAGRHFAYQVPQLFDLGRYDSAVLSLLAPASVGQPPPESYIFARLVESLAIVGLFAPENAVRVGLRAIAFTAVLILPVAFFADSRSGYFFAPRQVIFVLVPLYVLAASGCVAIAAFVGKAITRLARPLAIAALAATIVLGSYGSIRAAIGDDRSKENWRAAADEIAAGLCPGGRVIVDVGAGYSFGVGYYRPELLPSIVKVTALNRDPRGLIEALEGAQLGPTDWVLLRGSGTAANQVNEALLWLARRGYRYDWSFRLAFTTPPHSCGGSR